MPSLLFVCLGWMPRVCARWRAGLLLTGWFIGGGLPVAGQQGKPLLPAAEVTLNEELDKALREFSGKVAEQRRKLWDEAMTEQIQHMTRELKLTEAQQGDLKAASTESIKAALVGWEDKIFDWLKPHLGRSGNAIRDLARWPEEGIAQSADIDGVMPPEMQTAWRGALDRVLMPEQKTRWQEVMQAQQEEEQRELEEYVDFLATGQTLPIENALAAAVGWAPRRD